MPQKVAALTEFTVAQYNILADQYGDNRQPWFLYGVDLSEEKRKAIVRLPGARNRRGGGRALAHAPIGSHSHQVKSFYARDADGKFKNKGWPTWAVEHLSDDKLRCVERVGAEHFEWERRKLRLIDAIAGLDADLVSLVELDHYDDVFQPGLAAHGYKGIWAKRPRASSHDGAAIFWRDGTFELVAQQRVEFIDSCAHAPAAADAPPARTRIRRMT
jgi:hypothetical protein